MQRYFSYIFDTRKCFICSHLMLRKRPGFFAYKTSLMDIIWKCAMSLEFWVQNWRFHKFIFLVNEHSPFEWMMMAWGMKTPRWNSMKHNTALIIHNSKYSHYINLCGVVRCGAAVWHPLKITVAIIFNESVDKHPMRTHSISVSFAQKLTTRKWFVEFSVSINCVPIDKQPHFAQHLSGYSMTTLPVSFIMM